MPVDESQPGADSGHDDPDGNQPADVDPRCHEAGRDRCHEAKPQAQPRRGSKIGIAQFAVVGFLRFGHPGKDIGPTRADETCGRRGAQPVKHEGP